MSAAERSWAPLVGKAIVSGWAYALGLVIAGMLTSALHLVQPVFPRETVTPAHQLLKLLGVCGLLGLFLAPAARGLLGGFTARWAALALLIFVCLGVNGLLEMRIFTTYLVRGGAPSLLLGNFLGAVLCGGALAGLLGAEPPEVTRMSARKNLFASRGAASWIARLIAAEFAFPMIYFLFGMIVSPFVVWAYRDGRFGLVIPAFGIILKTLFVRSALFLAASFPFVVWWRKSLLQLIVALGLAHWMLVGLFGLLLGGGFPMILRVAHSLEIGADSFAYAAALVFLLRPRN